MTQDFERKYEQLDELDHHQTPVGDVEDRELAAHLEVVQYLRRAAESARHANPAGPLFTRQVLGRVRRRTSWLRWSLSVAALLLMAIALKVYLGPADPSTQVQAASAKPAAIQFDHQLLQQAIDADARDDMVAYLVGTEKLILSLREPDLVCTQEKVNLAPEKDLAKQLLMQQKRFQTQMGGVDYMHVRDFFGQVEMVLVDLNSLDGCSDLGEIHSLTEIIEEKHILSKLRLMVQEIQVS